MKQVVKSIIVAGAVAASSSAYGFFGDFCPYVGIDYQQIWMKGSGGWERFFPKSYPGFDLYVGGRFCENWGLELGWDWSAKRSRDAVVGSGTAIFNSGTTTAAHNVHSEVRRNGAHLDLMGFLPVWECLDLIGSVGIGWVEPRVTISDSTSGVTNADNQVQSAFLSTSGKSKAVWRLRVGLAYMVTDCVGLRGLVGWEGTKSLRVRGNASFNALGFSEKAFKNSTSLAAGVFVKF